MGSSCKQKTMWDFSHSVFENYIATWMFYLKYLSVKNIMKVHVQDTLPEPNIFVITTVLHNNCNLFLRVNSLPKDCHCQSLK